MGSIRTDILLVGKTGNGKSATANTIVGFKAFRSCSSQDAVTMHTQFEVGQFESRILKVVDSPGVGDTRLDKHEGAKLVIDAMNVAIAANPSGYHCILLVMRYGGRCTEEDIETVRLLKNIFGESFIKNHAILLLTCGDNFDSDVKDKTFEEWAASQQGYFKELLKECCGRVITFNNTTKDSQIKTEQMRKLMKMIDRMSANGTRYTSDIFMKAKETRDILLSKSTKKTLTEETMMECGLINQQLNCISFEDPEKTIGLLRGLRQRSIKLLEHVKQQDQGSNTLSGSIKLAQQLTETINENDKTAKEIFQLKQKIEQLELQQKMEQARLEPEDKKKKENRPRRQERAEKIKREEHLARQRIENEKERIRKRLQNFHESYEAVKKEESWTWGGVASALAAATGKWFRK